MVRGEEACELLGGVGRRCGLDSVAVVGGCARGEERDLGADGGEGGFVVGDPHIGAAGLFDMDVGAADVEAGELLRLGAFDEGCAGDDHVGLLGHHDTVGDDRHVAAASDAVAEDAGDLGHAVR